jgi:hypothetical protein
VICTQDDGAHPGSRDDSSVGRHARCSSVAGAATTRLPRTGPSARAPVSGTTRPGLRRAASTRSPCASSSP